ncbi:MAG: dTDP-4-dehydrorhamnose 3,5-epimerase [Oscillochloris sp.]|nr:dTDP-4-dehydrorhamnose 3,5-epimerase [Oscillochloris sp.]
MIFTATEVKDAYIIDPDRREDNRGFFACIWAEEAFAKQGLGTRIAQINLSYNRHKGTLRGMHFQHAPYGETKLVRCIRGAILDVIVDLRADSPSYKRWIGVELTAENRRSLYVPEGFAHGFQTLVDDVEVLYQVSQIYTPSAEGGVRHNDPTFGIQWPLIPSEMSEKDKIWPLFTD